MTRSVRGIRDLVVAVPARNEEALLPGCLRAVRSSVAALAAVRADITVCVVVALDGCTDRSGDIARHHEAVTVRPSSTGVGSARDAAIRRGLGQLEVRDLSTAWVACTDADSLVPSSWLARQVIWAECDMDLVIGTVEPFDTEDAVALAAWQERHQLGEGHRYVHGANLGVRASRWREAGGFGPLLLHEDVSLVGRVRQVTAQWVATDTTRVRTSGRSRSRVDGGFSSFLEVLGSA